MQKTETRNKKHRGRRIALTILCAIAVLIIGCLIHFAPLYREYKSSVYDILSTMDTGTFRRATNTTVEDKDGNLIAKIGYENYKYKNISDISKFLQDGYIAQEDKNFKTHHGVDWKAVARAVLSYIKNRGHITQGGSTITQQVVKNCMLTQEQTFSRKILEMMTAIQMEKEYNKAQIMEFYCNSCYYGNGCYGVEGAAEYYFGKTAKTVDLAEAAMIVGTSNLPNVYNPVADYETCMKKKTEVLDHMLEQGYITQEEHDAADAERPEIVKKTESGEPESAMATYAIHCAALKLMEHDGFEFRYTFDSSDAYSAYKTEYDDTYAKAETTIRSGGYTIRTSLDPDLCSQLQSAVNDTLAAETETADDGRYDMQAASVCIDNSTGMVVAVVGSRNEDDSYNRAYQAARQSGSSIKPLLDYGPALNEGVITPGLVMTDQAININGYKPTNSYSGYAGEMTVRKALARSVNTIAVQIFQNVGSDTALSYLDKLKFSTLAYGDAHNTAISLGGFTNGVTVEDMARGFATIENGGQMRDNTCIESLTSEVDGEIYRHSDESEEVYMEDAAFMLTDMMQGAFRDERGTARKYRNDSQIYAGKTGTTNDNVDAWFAGFSAYYTTVVWTGCDTPRSDDNLVGNRYPLQIWSAYMDKLHENLPKKDFTMPSTIRLSDGTEEKTPDYQDSGDIYSSRPSGWDYISEQLRENEEKHAYALRVKQEEEAAEKAVSDFEAFQITSIEEAAELDERYQSVTDTIASIEDESKRTDYFNRAAAKYDLLSGDVADNWKDAEEQQKEQQQEETYIENQKAADDSAEEALKTVEQIRKDTVQKYIDALNACTVYSDAVRNLESGADTALGRCAGYDGYDSLKSSLDQAKAYAEALPTQEQIDAEKKAAEQEAADAASQIQHAQSHDSEEE